MAVMARLKSFCSRIEAMNKTVLSIIIVVAVAAAGYAIYNSKDMKSESVASVAGENETTKTENEVEQSGKKMAFAQFVKQGGSYECTVNQYVENIESKGHVFIDGGRIRTEYSVDYQGTSMDGIVIIKDGFAYTWGSMMPMGIKVPIKDDGVNVDAGARGTYSWNAEQIGDYDCKAWNVDEAKFTLPAGINFQELPAA